ncbi:MAG TPA: transporter substrate-binding domain-containing protein [Vicinamibacterales bacterium]|nr:transporter substrate-binding domain-containing protein [Vicinamibacterales bacterium]
MRTLKRISVARLVADPYPPYQFEVGGVVVGCDYELVSEALAEGGLPSTIRLLPWDVCISELRAGAADAVFQIARTPERELEFLFSAPLRTERTLIYGHPPALEGLANFQGLEEVTRTNPLGVLRGFSYNPFVDRLRPQARVEADSQEELVRRLAEGTLQLALLDSSVAQRLLDRADARGVELVPGIEITRRLHLAVRRTSPGVLEAFKAGFAVLRTSGREGEILQHYGFPAAAPRPFWPTLPAQR